jgi:nitrous oxidase accessory protein NosD
MREALNLAHEGKQNMAMKPLPHALLLIAVFSCGASAAAVRHVDPEHPMTQDAGDGNAMRPYKTLNYAMRQIKPGDTLNIAAGTYREALIFPETDWSGGATLIQPASGDVVIKGTDLVTGWERIGDGLHVKRQWKTNSQQVFMALLSSRSGVQSWAGIRKSRGIPWQSCTADRAAFGRGA